MTGMHDWTSTCSPPKGQPDLAQVMFVMRGDFVEVVAQRAHAVDAMHPLEMAAALIVRAGKIDDGVASRFIHVTREVEGNASVVETFGPGILIHRPEHRTRLAEHTTDAVKEHGLAVGQVVEDI